MIPEQRSYQCVDQEEFNNSMKKYKDLLDKPALVKVQCIDGKTTLTEAKLNFFQRLISWFYKPPECRKEAIETFFHRFFDANRSFARANEIPEFTKSKIKVSDIAAKTLAIEESPNSSNADRAEKLYLLAIRYSTGTGGVEYDAPMAFKTMESAAHLGHAEAQHFLGVAYWGGKGVDKNPELAFKWMHQAAFSGSGRALYKLGLFYKEGIGCRPQPNEAFKWFSKAFITQPTTRPDLADNWTYDAAFQLSDFYEKGIAVPKDEKKAFEYCKIAADHGSPRALIRLAHYCLDEIGTNKDQEEAKRILEELHNQKNDRSENTRKEILKLQERLEKS